MIKNIKAREILDSRGNPTVEVELTTEKGVFLASVPSGASKGKYEALELRDKDGGVKKAIENINKIISPKLKGEDPTNQKKIDQILIKLDGTKNKSRLGANAILGVSMAVCRAGAKDKNLPLWQHIFQIYQYNLFLTTVRNRLLLPKPCFNIINGGRHAKKGLDIQEFMVIPQEKLFKKNLEIGKEIFKKLGEILEKKFGKSVLKVGDEGGFVPSISKTSEAIDLIMEAAKKCGYLNKIKIGLDCAASQFFEKVKYQLERKIFSKEELINFYQDLIKNYPIIYLEDPFSEEDWEGWQLLKSKIKNQKSKILVIGDDLLTTNPERIKLAKKKKACNAVIIKANQIGTITETIKAAKLAKSFGWKIIVSHRSGETNDDFIADLAVGLGADFIKAGAPSPKERMTKYNRLLKIEEELL